MAADDVFVCVCVCVGMRVCVGACVCVRISRLSWIRPRRRRVNSRTNFSYIIDTHKRIYIYTYLRPTVLYYFLAEVENAFRRIRVCVYTLYIDLIYTYKRYSSAGYFFFAYRCARTHVSLFVRFVYVLNIYSLWTERRRQLVLLYGTHACFARFSDIAFWSSK